MYKSADYAIKLESCPSFMINIYNEVNHSSKCGTILTTQPVFLFLASVLHNYVIVKNIKFLKCGNCH